MPDFRAKSDQNEGSLCLANSIRKSSELPLTSRGSLLFILLTCFYLWKTFFFFVKTNKFPSNEESVCQKASFIKDYLEKFVPWGIQWNFTGCVFFFFSMHVDLNNRRNDFCWLNVFDVRLLHYSLLRIYQIILHTFQG